LFREYFFVELGIAAASFFYHGFKARGKKRYSG